MTLTNLLPPYITKMNAAALQRSNYENIQRAVGLEGMTLKTFIHYYESWKLEARNQRDECKKWILNQIAKDEQESQAYWEMDHAIQEFICDDF